MPSIPARCARPGWPSSSKGPRAKRNSCATAKIARIGEPDDIAALVAFILSPHGRLLAGLLIDADGGSKTI